MEKLGRLRVTLRKEMVLLLMEMLMLRPLALKMLMISFFKSAFSFAFKPLTPRLLLRLGQQK